MSSPRFRLKNLATSPHVTQLLLDATGPLAELHRRMLEAGCEVDPEWKLCLEEITSVDHQGKVVSRPNFFVLSLRIHSFWIP